MDYAKAFFWLEKAANQGLPRARFDLGGLYESGNGVAQDAAKAATLYRGSAEQGYVAAQLHLGLLSSLATAVGTPSMQSFIAWVGKHKLPFGGASAKNLPSFSTRCDSQKERTRGSSKGAPAGHLQEAE